MIEPTTAAIDNVALRLAGIEARVHLRHMFEERQVLLFIICPDYHPSPGITRDISRGGVGFLSDRELPSGTILAIQFRGKEEGEILIRIAEVVRSMPHEAIEDAPWDEKKKKNLIGRFFGLFRARPLPREEPGIHVIGCRFRTPLTAEELHSIR